MTNIKLIKDSLEKQKAMLEESNGINPDDIILKDEFNWSKYQQKVLDKWVNKCKTMEQAIVDMDAIISSLEVTADSLREMIEWCDDCTDTPCDKCMEEV
tara:strand:+ start:3187 stop:3483 length:297 start_codon:yes stop_codon:yes gene_type:complete